MKNFHMVTVNKRVTFIQQHNTTKYTNQTSTSKFMENMSFSRWHASIDDMLQ